MADDMACSECGENLYLDETSDEATCGNVDCGQYGIGFPIR